MAPLRGRLATQPLLATGFQGKLKVFFNYCFLVFFSFDLNCELQTEFFYGLQEAGTISEFTRCE